MTRGPSARSEEPGRRAGCERVRLRALFVELLPLETSRGDTQAERRGIYEADEMDRREGTVSSCCIRPRLSFELHCSATFPSRHSHDVNTRHRDQPVGAIPKISPTVRAAHRRARHDPVAFRRGGRGGPRWGAKVRLATARKASASRAPVRRAVMYPPVGISGWERGGNRVCRAHRARTRTRSDR